ACGGRRRRFQHGGIRRQSCGATSMLQDTWKYTVTAGWSMILPTGAIPPPRADASITYDPTNRVVLLFGGFGSGATLLGDMSSYAAGKWTLVCTTSGAGACGVGARFGAGLTFDTVDGKDLLFGGFCAAGPCSDTWAYKTSWILSSPPKSPSARWDTAMTFDPDMGTSTGEVLLFGGTDSAQAQGDTWEYQSGAGWTEVDAYT
ncbi:MAG: hypothetical protein L3J86_05220, partial [Thermoplasmata archaeon]|nr:hypothetical protein [Thermoplasmata archaeon]